MEYDPVTDSLIGFNSNGSIVQVDITTGGIIRRRERSQRSENKVTSSSDSQFRVSQAPWPVPSIVSSYSTVIDPVNRKYYASMIHFEQMEWLTVDISSWTSSFVTLKPALDYDHTVLIPE